MRYISPSLMCLEWDDEATVSLLCEKADYIHFDIMDSNFSPCPGLDPQLIAKLKDRFNPKFDIHIMSKFPSKHIKYCIKERCDYITFHVESVVDIKKTIDLIHKAGLMAGLAIKPDTTIDALTPHLPYVDLINVMLVNPGPAGQEFHKKELYKVVELNKLKNLNNFRYLIEVDGSCNEKHYNSIDSTSPNICVVGRSGLFGLNRDISLAWKDMERYMNTTKTIYIHADLVGNILKEAIKEWLLKEKYNVVDLYVDGSMEYPECAKELCEKIKGSESNMGLLFCGTGIGMAIAANKEVGIRAAVVSDVYSAKMAREHNNANVLCLGARVVAKEYANLIVKEFLSSGFLYGKHTSRVDRLN